MPASMIVGCGEAKAMATKQKVSRAITKKELAYLLSRLCTVDTTTMRVLIVNSAKLCRHLQKVRHCLSSVSC